MGGYKMKRDAPIQDGDRLDTIDQNDDDDDYQPPADFEYNDDGDQGDNN
jgi:hypothetical protein